MCREAQKQATIEFTLIYFIRNFDGFALQFQKIKIELKSLILAQIERWRYA